MFGFVYEVLTVSVCQSAGMDVSLKEIFLKKEENSLFRDMEEQQTNLVCKHGQYARVLLLLAMSASGVQPILLIIKETVVNLK